MPRIFLSFIKKIQIFFQYYWKLAIKYKKSVLNLNLLVADFTEHTHNINIIEKYILDID